MTKQIAIIGLGYVGLPLAVEFAKKRQVIGFDISKSRIKELKEGHDPTLEVEDKDLQAVIATSHLNHITPSSITTKGLFLTDKLGDIANAQIYIIAVPTPIDKNNHPDLTPLINASETVGKVISKGDIVVYESTVYPGATEEDCIPVIERTSGLKFNVNFFAGYSPERINPGDKVHTLTAIMKVTSGSTPEIGKEINELYAEIITAGTYLASSIKVAEAAKVIENSQRDINIAFVNELSKMFNKMGIDTLDVLDAARTKWNFLPFHPGLVGGHCIGVDPFYLAQKAQEAGYHPEIILAGRRINDSMGGYIAGEVIKLLLKSGKQVRGAKALLLGITFKENCPDIRNTRAIDIYLELQGFGMDVSVFDPWADPEEVKKEYNIDLIDKNSDFANSTYETIILAVSHEEFKTLDYKKFITDGSIIFDVKGILPKENISARL